MATEQHDEVGTQHDEVGTQECAVCWQEGQEIARLPCCTAPAGSTMLFCVRCIEIICEQAPGGVGRCPTCREFIKKGSGQGTFEVADRVETCTLCRQARLIIGEIRGGPVCDACMLGQGNPLRYECERCRRNQRIPHPMYRYQPTAERFGDVTWACHVGCNAQTHWRVATADVHLVPAADAPESWGVRDAWLDRVRAQRRQERVGGVAPAGNGGEQQHRHFLDSWKGLLAILIALLFFGRS